MSRYVIENDGRHEIVVGWDPPLGTFFGQIFAPQLPEDEEECIWWAVLEGAIEPMEVRLERLDRLVRGVSGRVGRVEAWMKEEEEEDTP